MDDRDMNEIDEYLTTEEIRIELSKIAKARKR